MGQWTIFCVVHRMFLLLEGCEFLPMKIPGLCNYQICRAPLVQYQPDPEEDDASHGWRTGHK